MSKMYLNEEQEKELNYVDRLGLAYCRLNSWGWDEIIGPKPDEFDKLPWYDNRKFKKFRRKIRTKSYYLTPAIEGIKSIAFCPGQRPLVPCLSGRLAQTQRPPNQRPDLGSITTV